MRSAIRDFCGLADLAFILLASMLILPGFALAQPSINVLVAEPKGYYQDAADSLANALGRQGWKVNVSTAEPNSADGADLTVAIGTKALEAALARPARPVLSLLVPRSTYERLAAGRQGISALYLDQPLDRQLQLLELALPGLKKVGAPLGPASRELKDPLQIAAQDNGIQVRTAVIEQSSDLYSALTELASESQAFILFPDPLVGHRASLQSFFLHTYRLKRPVMAYSAPLAKSGAIMSLYATPEQLGEEAAGWIAESWSNARFRLGAPRYPKRFTISINSTVARSLDIPLPSVDVLTRKLEGMQ